VMYLTMTVASPFMGKLLQTVDIRIILSVSACLVGGAFLLMSVSNEIWMFYLAAVLLGLGEITILWLAIPTLINRWFVERAGFFIGLCMAFTGIGGAIWSAVFTALTASGVDFHTIYLIWGVIALVTSLSFTLFCVRNSPEDCGLAPYGASMQKAASGAEVAAKPSGLSAGFVMKTPMFYAICIFAGLINIAILIAMQFPTYTKSLTDVAFDVAVVGGVMTSVMMVGQAIFKVVLGAAADKNAKGALIFAFAAGVAGILLCWFGTFSEYVMRGRFIFGGCTPPPWCSCRSSAASPSAREYSVIYSRVSTVFSSPPSRHDLGVARLVVRLHRRVRRRWPCLVILLLGLYIFGRRRVQKDWTTE
ncbi:MAG: MFS transporter, partial [Adlercreutzia equolifaciens]